ncbi:MAG: YfcE family phosphodiesterase [Actinobacteria bacterium HGW-Actinobacteria-6]|jgi:predicted phosphodiesterase|nr:MAG: YfcE family phosphodiesterase [Actinobacteria bacterium HGW-Actinobacteria-6]
MRRIALYSDIHGNPDALDAVYDDMAGVGVAERVCLGDLVGYGADPAGVIARVRASGDAVVQGNYDRGIGGRLGNCGCYYATEQAKVEGEASYDFTDAHVGDVDSAWLAGLPSELRLEYHGVSIVLCHGSPRRVNEYLLPDRTDTQLERLAREAFADVVCVGHVHVPYHRTPAPGVHYVSSGSVGKPKDGDSRACWVELVLGTEQEALATGDALAAPAGCTDIFVAAVFHRVRYDIESQVHAMAEAGLPTSFGEALHRG